MNRKHFLSSTGILMAGSALRFKKHYDGSSSAIAFKKPHYLKAGDVIGITCPAGNIKYEELQPCIQLMESWGFNIKLGNTIGKKEFTFGGTDSERMNDLQSMLNDHQVKAIMCARGGYGSVRIVDQLDWNLFRKHPKWLIGFSDITVLINHIHTNLKVAAIHSKMCNSFPEQSKAEPVQIDSINSIRDALTGVTMKYNSDPFSFNKAGKGSGILVGGNLKTIESLTGSKSDIHTEGKILFVEDTGEYLYSIDRMFWNLKRTGKLHYLKGLIIGGFNIKPDDQGEEFGKSLQEIVLEKVQEFNYPVCFNFPVGHQKANFAMKCGIQHRLTVDNNKVQLDEII